METRVRRVLLTAAALLALPGCATVQRWRTHRAEVREARAEARAEAEQAQSPQNGTSEIPPPAIRPEVARRRAKAPRIKSSNWEIGAHFGVLLVRRKITAAKCRRLTCRSGSKSSAQVFPPPAAPP